MTHPLISARLLALAASGLCLSSAQAQQTGRGWTIFFPFNGAIPNKACGQPTSSGGDFASAAYPPKVKIVSLQSTLAIPLEFLP